MARERDYRQGDVGVGDVGGGPQEAGRFQGRMTRLHQAVGASNDADLAKILGIKHQSVSSARKRLALPFSWIVEVAARFRVSADWLLFGDGSMQRKAQEALTPEVVVLKGQDRPLRPSSEAREPVEAGYEAGAVFQAGELVLPPLVLPRLDASGVCFERSDRRPPVAFQHFWLAARGRVDQMVLLHMQGEHMSPTLVHGELLLVDRSRCEIVPGNIFVLAFGREVTVRRLDRLPGRLLLQNDNPAYARMEVDLSSQPDPAESVRVMGRVVWNAREWA